MKQLIGIGAGGHAKVIIDILKMTNDYELVGLLDSNQTLWGTHLYGVSVLGNDDLLPELYQQNIKNAFIGLGSIGNTQPRAQLYKLARKHNFQIASIIHPTATVSSSVQLGDGITIMAGAIINGDVMIGENVIINTGAIIEHDCIVGNHVHIATGAKLASTIQVGEGTHIGIGSSIRQCIKIGKNVTVGVGAVVIDDIPDNTVVVGVPARILRRTKE